MTITTRKEDARVMAARQLARARTIISKSVRHLTEAGLAEHATAIGASLKSLDTAIEAVGDAPPKPKRDKKPAEASVQDAAGAATRKRSG